MRKLQQELQLTIPVKVSYEMLPEMLVEGELLPEEVDIVQVLVEIPSGKGSIRRVNLLKALDVSTIMLLEDELLNRL